MVECWQVRTAFSEEELVRTLGLGPFGYLDGRASWRFDKLKDRLAKVRERDTQWTIKRYWMMSSASRHL